MVLSFFQFTVMLVVMLEIFLTRTLSYADYIALLAPTPSAMRKMLQVCDEYVVELNI